MNSHTGPAGCPTKSILPRYTHLLSYQARRISTWLGAEHLRAAVKHFRCKQVALLVRGEFVHSPQFARVGAKGAPRVEHFPVQVVLQHLERSVAVGHPEVAVFRQEQMIDRRVFAQRPNVQELSVLVENLDAAIFTVRNKYAMRYSIGLNAMHVVEIVWRRRIRQARHQLSGAPIPARLSP